MERCYNVVTKNIVILFNCKGKEKQPMPEISLFYGIRITMYWSDHNPPHFYAEYGKNKKDNKPLNRINPLIKKD